MTIKNGNMKITKELYRYNYDIINIYVNKT